MVTKKERKRFLTATVIFIVLVVLVVFFMPITIVQEDRGDRIQDVPKTIFDLYRESQTQIEIPVPPSGEQPVMEEEKSFFERLYGD